MVLTRLEVSGMIFEISLERLTGTLNNFDDNSTHQSKDIRNLGGCKFSTPKMVLKLHFDNVNFFSLFFFSELCWLRGEREIRSSLLILDLKDGKL